MSKRNLLWNESKLERYINEGRGNGIGKEYKPWITVQDFPSLGRASRILGWKTNRMHEFMSDNELKYFYMLEWSDIVIDIREQFPLLKLEKAKEVAYELGIKYPEDKKTKMPYILTTDFLITIKVEGREKHIARTIKPSEELNKSRVIEKLEIERRYWNSYDIDWGIVTEKDIPNEFVKNIEWIHPCYKLQGSKNLELKEALSLASMLKERLLKANVSVRDITSHMDKEMNIEAGTSLYLFKYLIANKEINLDISKKIDLSQLPTEIISVPLSCETKLVGGL